MSQAALREEMLQIGRQNRQVPVYIASPEKVEHRPAVIVVHEIFGLNDHIKDICRRFAGAGFTAAAPDLFAQADGLPDDRNDLAAMRAVWQKIPDSQLIADLQAVQAELAKRADVAADKVGTIGYCMGGAIAYMFACSGSGVAWVADYYGRVYYPQLSETKPKHPIDYTDGLMCPVFGAFAGVDELITAEHVKEFEQRIAARKVPHEIKVYGDAHHAFFNDVREFYNKDAAMDAWRRTLDFVGKSLQSTVQR